MVTTYVEEIDGTSVVKLRGFNIQNYFFNAQLSLNEDDNNVDEQLNYINYKRNVRKLHDYGWKHSYLTSDDVFMIYYGCGVSQYS